MPGAASRTTTRVAEDRGPVLTGGEKSTSEACIEDRSGILEEDADEFGTAPAALPGVGRRRRCAPSDAQSRKDRHHRGPGTYGRDPASATKIEKKSGEPLGREGAEARRQETAMLHAAVVFLVIALIAAIFGFTSIAAGAAGIAKVLFVLFVVLAVATFFFGRNRGG
jgi:uncharacterized membrane protein YtjA (UPF0391 family)